MIPVESRLTDRFVGAGHHLLATAVACIAGGTLVVAGAAPVSASFQLAADSTVTQSAVFGATHQRSVDQAPADAVGGTARYIVSVTDEAALAEVLAWLSAAGVQPDNSWHGPLNGFSAVLGPATVAVLSARADVTIVEPDSVTTADDTQTNPPWGLDRVDQHTQPLSNTYSPSSTGAGVTAYVLDTGLWLSHTEFAGRVPRYAFWDFGDSTGAWDCNGHGTHTAGTLGGTTYGVAKQVTIVPVKVLDCSGSGPTTAIVAGINWIITDHLFEVPAVVNISLGPPGISSSMDAAVQAMISDGITVAAAAGNDAAPSCNYSPGHLADVITVAASEIDDDDANYSNYGACNDIFAPGTDVLSAAPGSSNTATAIMSGTSMASPHVAGAAALVLQTQPTLSPVQVWAVLDAASTKGVLSECCGDPDKLLYVASSLPLPPVQPTLSVSVVGAGTVTSSPGGIACSVNCSAPFNLNSQVTLTAAPSPGSTFFRWSGACAGAGAGLVCTVTMTGALSATAQFVQQVTLAVTKSGTGSGSVTSAPAGIACGSTCGALFNPGTVVTLTASADPGSAFIGWGSGACSGGALTCTVTVNAAMSVEASFTHIPSFVATTLKRLIDTRDGQGLRMQDSVTQIPVAGLNGIAYDAVAVALNVTVTATQGAGYLTVYPCGSPRPTASNVNFVPGQTIPNMVIAAVGAGGSVCIYTSVATHLIVDINGYFPAGGGFGPTSPARLADTRASGVVRPGNSVFELPVACVAATPCDATAVALNVTVTEAQGNGYVTVYPCGTDRPTASNLNFAPGQTIPNAVVAKVGTGGKVCLYTSSTTHLIVDLNGWFTARSDFGPLPPARLFDTRSQNVPFGYSETRALQVSGTGGVPVGASAVVLNVTVTGPAVDGFVVVYPCYTALPLASNVNYAAGQTIPNAVIAKLSGDGKVCVYSSAPTHIIVDVNGWFYVP